MQQQLAERFLYIHKPKRHFKQTQTKKNKPTTLACLKSYQDGDQFRARDANSHDREAESL